MADVTTRIDVALEKVRWQKLTVRGIYLDPADSAALDKIRSREFGMKIYVLGYATHPIHYGKHSAVYTTTGERFSIPKRLSHRVGDVAA